jgi:hypothetical protein
VVPAQIIAKMKLMLQGPYSGTSMQTALQQSGLVPTSQPYGSAPWNYGGSELMPVVPAGVVDWILVELRTDQTTVAGSRAALLKSDGTVVDTDGSDFVTFPGLTSGNYYIVVIHRTHLSVMSANTVLLTSASDIYDFSTGASKAFGSGAQVNLGSGVYGMWSGDADATGTVDALDRNATWNSRNAIGYLLSDVDLSGDVSALDRNATWNNRNLFTQVPAKMAGPILSAASIEVGKGE